MPQRSPAAAEVAQIERNLAAALRIRPAPTCMSMLGPAGLRLAKRTVLLRLLLRDSTASSPVLLL